MCAVGAFSAGEMCFCTYFTYCTMCRLLYFENYVNYACYFIKMKTYLLLFVQQWLNVITYPWILAPFGEISDLGFSSLLVLLP